MGVKEFLEMDLTASPFLLQENWEVWPSYHTLHYH